MVIQFNLVINDSEKNVENGNMLNKCAEVGLSNYAQFKPTTNF